MCDNEIWCLVILDTIPGRQSMAACFFLLKQFDDVLIYLNSVKVYLYLLNHSQYTLLRFFLCAIGH